MQESLDWRIYVYNKKCRNIQSRCDIKIRSTNDEEKHNAPQ